MAWTAPMTFSAAVLTYAQLNTYLRDNLNETAAAKATTSGSYFAGTGANSLAERTHRMAFDVTTSTTTSTNYGGLVGSSGPAVSSLTTGTAAMTFISAAMSNSTAGAACDMGLDISGATTSGPTVQAALKSVSANGGELLEASYAMFYTLTAGSNTFTLQYRVSNGTGTFSVRRLIVMPF